MEKRIGERITEQGAASLKSHLHCEAFVQERKETDNSWIFENDVILMTTTPSTPFLSRLF